MNRWMKSALAATVLGAAAASQAGTDIGVSIDISQPGVYGRIDIGRFPQPQVVVQQPVIVMPPRYVEVRPEPVYLWVPPGHRRDWRHHCRSYNACGVPVYFVQEGWYQRHVWQGPGREHRRDKGDDRHGGWDYRDDHHPGKGKGKDKDHGHGHGRGHD